MGAFGEALKVKRQQACLTQEELAKRAGISGAYLSYLETGKRIPPPRILVSALADSLGCDASFLWQLARHERTSHVERKIEGSPASLRTSIRTRRSTDSSALREGEIERAATAIAEDRALRRFVLQLVDAMPSRESRRQFLDSLSAVMQRLPQSEENSD